MVLRAPQCPCQLKQAVPSNTYSGREVAASLGALFVLVTRTLIWE